MRVNMLGTPFVLLATATLCCLRNFFNLSKITNIENYGKQHETV